MLARIKTRAKRPVQKRKLTELFIQTAKPRDSAYQVWDTRQHNLCLRIQPGGSKSWVVVYSRHGRSRWLTLGNAKAIGLSDARMLAAKAMLAVAEGKDPAAEKRAARGPGTFAELADKYVQLHAKRHNKSWRASDGLIQHYVLPRFGKLAASAITRPDIRALMAKMSETPSSPTASRRRCPQSLIGASAKKSSSPIRASWSRTSRSAPASVLCPIPNCRSSGKRSANSIRCAARR